MSIIKYILTILLLCSIHVIYCSDSIYDDYETDENPTREEHDFNVTFDEKSDSYFNIYANNSNQLINCTVISRDFNCTMEINSTSCGSTEPNVNGWMRDNRCQIMVNRIKEYYPRYWEVIAYDNETNMIINRYTVTFYYVTPVVLDEIRTVINAGFMQYITLETKMQNCNVSDGYSVIVLSLDSENVEFLSESPLKNRITSIGRGKCGFKLLKTLEADPNSYVLKATDVNGRDYRKTFKTILEKMEVINETHILYPNTKFTLKCENENQYYRKSGFCSLYNPKGELVDSNVKLCKADLMITTADYGIWKCVLGYHENIESIVKTIEIKELGMQDTYTFQEDMGDYLRFGCIVVNPSKMIKVPEFCKMTDPQGVEYQITPSAASKRITTLTLDLSNFVCSIEIKKPLLETEKGLWFCDVSDVGGAISVYKSEEIIYPKSINRTIRDGSPHKILCKVLYSSNYCYITSPNGTKFESDVENTWWLGECSYNLMNVNILDNGTWHCHFSREMGQSFEKIDYDIQIAEKMMYYKDIDVDLGDRTNLLCTTHGAALKHCMFESPSNEVYYIYENTSNVFDYYGKGLAEGDCGITIKKIEKIHDGQWKCILKLFDSTDDKIAPLQLSVQNPISETTIATSIGIGIGILLILSSTIAFYLIRRRRNRNNNNNNDNNVNNNETRRIDDDNNNIPLRTITASSYLLENNQDRNRDSVID